jgi:hypothetical protein
MLLQLDPTELFRSEAMPIRCVVVCLIALFEIGGAPPPPDRQADRYRQLVADYRRQDFTSVSTVAAFSAADLRASIARSTDVADVWTAEDRRAAAMLHTDALTQLLTKGQSDAARLNLNAAMALLNESMRMDQPSRRFASVWYTSVAAMLSRLGAPEWAQDTAERRQAIVPVTAGEGGFKAGLELETNACDVRERLVDSFGMRVSRPLHSAAKLFGGALRSDPSLHAAALHLGRVRMIQGSLGEARLHLEVGTHSELSSERYLALLFLGAIAEQTGDLGDAEARYRSAMREFKWGQSGPLALSRLLSRSGRDHEAREIVVAFLGRGAPTVDPL